MSIHKGVIVRLVGSRSSGLALLEIDDERRGRVILPCENAPTVRALDAAFGDVIAPGHTFNHDAIADREIYYSTDDLGLLEGFTPVDMADADLFEAYARSVKRGSPGNTDLGFCNPDDPIYSLGPVVAERRIFNSPKKLH